jgi:pre-mRNA-splicing factor SYF1
MLAPDCPAYNPGIVDALLKNDVLINISGHDHVNEYSGLYTKEDRTIELLYGRKSGYGSYGPDKGINRGGTVITIKNLGEVVD